jgi:AraC-like DNA-binding protein
MAIAAAHHTIAIVQVVQILQGAKSRGLDCDRVLRHAGIAPALLESPLSRVTQAQYARLISSLCRLTNDELWGLCEHPLPLGSFAMSCQLLVHQKTLGEAMQIGARYYHQQLRDFVPRLQVAGSVASLRLTAALPNSPELDYAQRAFMFFSFGLACWLVGRRIPLLEVIYSEPTDSVSGLQSEASRLFQAPVRFESAWIGYRFDSRWLDLPIVQTEGSAREFLHQVPHSLLIKYRDQTSLTERIRRLLRRNLTLEPLSLEDVSSALAMTPQTLRRRLQREGQGYQTIKDSLRRDVAVEYLSRPELSLIDIANRLGFSEASTFHRAFKGWTGLAPGIYRQRRLSDADADREN